MTEKKEIFDARSKEDGIVFRSNKIPALTYEATIDSSGEIKPQVLPTVISCIREMGVSIKTDQKKVEKTESYCKIAIGIIAILSIIISKQVSIAIALIYFSMIALRDLIKFCQLSCKVKLGKYKSVGRFHAAEHKAINAYQTKGGIPSIEEIKRASQFEKKCGSRSYIDKIVSFGLVSIIIALAPFIKFYVYVILFILVLVFSMLGKKYGIFRFLQIFVTNKPTEKELEVALAGVQLFDKMEAEIPEDCCPIGFMVIAMGLDDEEEESAEM